MRIKDKLIILVILAIIFVCCFIWFIFTIIPNSHSVFINFGVNDSQGENGDFYFTDTAEQERGVVSRVIIENNNTYRYLQKRVTSGIFQPREHLSMLHQLDFTLNHISQRGDLYLRLLCEDCAENLPDLPLYINGIESYNKIKLLDDVYVYNKKMEAYDSLSRNIEEYLINEVDSSDSVLITPEIKHEIDYKKIETSLSYDASNIVSQDIVFSSALSLLIQSPKDLSLEFIKKNSNSTKEDDDCEVQIIDLNENIVAEYSIPSDDVSSGSRNITIQETKLNFTLPEEGVYKINFIPNNNDDFDITGIRMNTNKVIFLEGSASKYTKLFYQPIGNQAATMVVNSMDVDNIEFKNESEEVVYTFKGGDKSVLNKDYDISLPVGTYSLEATNKLSFKNGYFALSEDALFNPYPFYLINNGFADHLISRLNFFTTEGDYKSNNYYTQFELNSIEEHKKKIPFELVANVAQDDSNRYSTLWNDYHYIQTICDYMIYSKYLTAKNENYVDCNDQYQVITAISNVIPTNQEVAFWSEGLNASNFYSIQGVKNFDYSYTENKINSQGDSVFAFYTAMDLNIEMEFMDLNSHIGEDSINISIFDIDGNEVYTSSISDDGNSSEDNMKSKIFKNIELEDLSKNVYLLYVKTEPARINNYDVIVSKININTNKLIQLSPVQVYGTSSLYIEYNKDHEVFFNHVNSNGISINIDNEPYAIKASNKKKEIIALESGEHKIEIDQAGVEVSNTNVAFSSDGFFQFEHYQTGDNYIVTDAFLWPVIKLNSMSINYY